MSKLTLILITTTLILTGVFLTYPDLDITVSSWFYTQDEGFTNREHPLNLAMYFLIRAIAVGTTLWCFGVFALRKFKPQIQSKLIPQKRYAAFILIAMLLGPGVIVHQGFKEYYERARPVNIQEFGGVKTYSAPFVKSDQKGKSFVSGHSAMGFFLCAFAFLTSGRKRCYIYCGGLIFGTIAASSRIVQGGHYLSDTVFGALVTLLTIQLVYWLVIKRRE